MMINRFLQYTEPLQYKWVYENHQKEIVRDGGEEERQGQTEREREKKENENQF